MISSKYFSMAVILISILSTTGCNGLPNLSQSQDLPMPSAVSQQILDEKYPDVVHNTRFLLSQQLQVPPDEISIQSVESVVWPDSCLGITLEGQSCDSKPVSGYSISLDVHGEQYIYHTDQGNQIHLVSAPNELNDEIIIQWTSSTQVCLTSKMDLENISFGECGASMITTPFSAIGAPDDLIYFWETYTPFTTETPIGKIVFRGNGKSIATSAEQRMIAEWSHMTTMISIAGRSGAAWGNVIAWRRNNCDHLTIFAMGYALAGTCEQDAESLPARLRLSPKQLEQLYSWYDQYQSFEIHKTPESNDFPESIYLLFSGQGAAIVTETESQGILNFAADIFDQFMFADHNQ